MFKPAAEFVAQSLMFCLAALFNFQNKLDQRFHGSRAPCPLCPRRSPPQVCVTYHFTEVSAHEVLGDLELD